MSLTPEPAIWSTDTGQWTPCFDSCQLTITWMSNLMSWTLTLLLTPPPLTESVQMDGCMDTLTVIWLPDTTSDYAMIGPEAHAS